MSRRYLSLTLCLAVSAATVVAQDNADDRNTEEKRLAESAVVIAEILDIPDNVPQEVLDRAECIIVIPSTMKVAMGFGGSYGRGAMVCRSGEAFDGAWGAPAMYAIEGGSFGLQIGVEATDIVLMVMSPRSVDALLSSQVKLGGNASAAAGPKGRHVEASTDASMRAEILSYSRSRGLFAGISLDGMSLRPDDDATERVYGRRLGARTIIGGVGVTVPASAQALVDVLQERAPHNQSGNTPVDEP
jgi:lipid-binding SYLF domain-containing protein